MPTKTILSPAQRAVIFDPPADRATIERFVHKFSDFVLGGS